MAWDVLKEPFPGYHPAVGPEVPRPDNTAANLVAQGGEATGRLIAAGTDTAIGAFIRAAIARKDAELQAQKLVQDSALTLNAQRIAEQQGLRNYNLTSQHYKLMETTAGANSDAAMGAASLADEVTARANELKVLDPEFQTKNPVQFAANLNKLMDEYPQAPAYTGIPDKFKQLQAIANDQKVSVKYGAVKDPALGTWFGGQSKDVPIWQVVRDLYDPKKRDYTINVLEAGGHVQVNKEKVTETKPRTLGWGHLPVTLGETSTTKTVTQRQWDPLINDVLKGRYDFSRGENKMKSFVPKRSLPQAIKYGTDLYDSRTTPAGELDSNAPLPTDEIPIEPTDITGPETGSNDTTQILGFARKAIAQGAPFPAVAERLKSMSIDPNQIWAA